MFVTLSFLIASPVINEVAVVILFGILGWQLTLMYVASGLTVAYVGGVIMERFRPDHTRLYDEYRGPVVAGDDHPAQGDPLARAGVVCLGTCHCLYPCGVGL